MVRIAKFEKVSLERFVTDWLSTFPQQSIEQAVMVYEHIQLPQRATRGSAGYDFFAPIGFELPAGATLKMPTGIRAVIEEGWVLTLYPRSSLGFKYRFQLDNSVGIIDSDYAHSDNEGHIFLRMTNDNREGKGLRLAAGAAFAQGVFLPFGITVDDDAQGVRNGGFGSTTRV
ncbi:MAG: deoxyuridine 5'-triphosphate nucleotidohydrolase [Clostridia bacterium]|nr:deoxyuridine 5'-triphosphate nucleotidohydrolase [Clostridia bacterium]